MFFVVFFSIIQSEEKGRSILSAICKNIPYFAFVCFFSIIIDLDLTTHIKCTKLLK